MTVVIVGDVVHGVDWVNLIVRVMLRTMSRATEVGTRRLYY